MFRIIKDKTQVAALKRLLSLLHPAQDSLFQRVLTGVRPTKGPWFANAPMGKTSLSNLMPVLLVWAKLSKRYTNHCIRATVVTELKDAGYYYEVCAVTVQKHEASLQHYDRIDRRGSKRQHHMADVLDGKRPFKESRPTDRISTQEDNKTVERAAISIAE